MYIITQKKVKMHYRSYDLSFGHAADPLKAFGKQYFVGLKAIANKLGFGSVRDFYLSFTEDGFKGSVPDSLRQYEVELDRAASLALITEANGNASKYRIAELYANHHSSNTYGFWKGNAKLRLSSLLTKLPPDAVIGDFLWKLEERAKKRVIEDVKVRCYSDGYFYQGLPSEVMLVTWLRECAVGISTGLSATYYASAMSSEFVNPHISTLQGISAWWGMSLKAFILAIEKDELLLLPSHYRKDSADNSKRALLERTLLHSDYRSWYELAMSFPEEKRIAVKNLPSTPSSDISICTLLSVLEHLEMRLSDIII